jgi:hypothetical protein
MLCNRFEIHSNSSDNEYVLKLRPDYNTKGHTQWFYFQVSNTKSTRYTFHLVNLIKKESLYAHGLRPLMFSMSHASYENKGWQRVGTNMSYLPTPFWIHDFYEEEKCGRLFTLTFTVQFDQDFDICYFSHCFPYTYTDLQHLIRKILKEPEYDTFLRHKVLGESILKNK